MRVKGYTRRDGTKVKGHTRKGGGRRHTRKASRRQTVGRHHVVVRRGGKRVGVRTRRHRVHKIRAVR